MASGFHSELNTANGSIAPNGVAVLGSKTKPRKTWNERCEGFAELAMSFGYQQ
jgi:hypothetical protein